MDKDTGVLTETRGEVSVEWRIETPCEEARYSSPVFPLSDSCWRLEIGFYGRSSVDIYLQREDYGPPKTLSFTIGFKKADDTEEVISREDFTFTKGCENKRFVAKNVESVQYSHGIMIVICSLSSKEHNFLSVSLFKRLLSMSATLTEILKAGKNTDVVLKVMNEKVKAHRLILDTRCPDFLSRVECEMKDDPAGGTAEAESCDEGTLFNVLSYLYSGELDELSQSSVAPVYEFAHKYQLVELKKLCTEFMEKTLTEDDVCDTIIFANEFKDERLKESAKEYFAQHSSLIVETLKWKEFKKKNSDLCVEILEHMMKKEGI